MGVITVVGIGADGWDGLPASARDVIGTADALLGGERQLDLVPGRPGQTRATWPSPLRARLPALLESYAGRRVVALASGDPLVSGIGATLIDVLGPDRVEIVPAVSSVALARARMGWPAETCDVVTLVGRDPRLLVPAISPGRRIIVLCSDGRTPQVVSALLVEQGYAASRLTVLSDLGAAGEARTEATASSWGDRTAPPLNLVCVECVADATTVVGSRTAGLADAVFEHDGQLTKRDVRASALARLAPSPGALLWDIGAGAGSISVEWMRTHPTCRAVAVEADSERADRCARNASALGVPGLDVVRGRAPEALAGLPTPDAVFVGGGATATGVLDTCWDALGPGGRLVVHGVTLETEALLLEQLTARGGELTRISIEHADAIGSFTGWSPARAVVQWSVAR